MAHANSQRHPQLSWQLAPLPLSCFSSWSRTRKISGRWGDVYFRVSIIVYVSFSWLFWANSNMSSSFKCFFFLLSFVHSCFIFHLKYFGNCLEEALVGTAPCIKDIHVESYIHRYMCKELKEKTDGFHCSIVFAEQVEVCLPCLPVSWYHITQGVKGEAKGYNCEAGHRSQHLRASNSPFSTVSSSWYL